MHRIVCGLCLLLLLVPLGAVRADSGNDGYVPVQKLLDLSGLAWLGGDRFLVVHDAKNPDEPDRVRVSFLKLPQSLDGVLWKPLDVQFPEGASSDLESAAAVPGTGQVLLVESGDDASDYQRIFLADVNDAGLSVTGTVKWGAFDSAYNVEASAVVGQDGGYRFLWAERNSGKQSTTIQWVAMTLSPFAIGPKLGEVTFTLPPAFVDANGKPLYSRPVVGLDVAGDGQVYAVAAYDPEGVVANPDNGPFRSVVLKIGTMGADGLVLDEAPAVIAEVDGFKTESVVAAGEPPQLFIGTDDENYGGVLRPLLP